MSPTRDPSAATRVIHAACPHDCPDTCAIRVTVAGEQLIRLQGEPDHPTTHGALCTKVSRYAERNSHPERVLQPLRRVGPKGSGQFEPVGWDEALEDIAARLKAIAARDPQAILPYSYAGTMGFVQGEAMAGRFFHRLGASQLNRTICAEAGATGLALTYGATVGMHLEHFAESRLILIWGSNSIASNLHFWTYAQAAKRGGAKLIAIDPRRTETAEKCHQHIALRPGTDSALALGLMHELVVNDWLDHDYLARHVEGWPELRERALQWPPERAAEVCGITADEVRGLARDYGSTAPAAIRLNYGMQRVRGGGNAARAAGAEEHRRRRASPRRGGRRRARPRGRPAGRRSGRSRGAERLDAGAEQQLARLLLAHIHHLDIEDGVGVQAGAQVAVDELQLAGGQPAGEDAAGDAEAVERRAQRRLLGVGVNPRVERVGRKVPGPDAEVVNNAASPWCVHGFRVRNRCGGVARGKWMKMKSNAKINRAPNGATVEKINRAPNGAEGGVRRHTIKYRFFMVEVFPYHFGKSAFFMAFEEILPRKAQPQNKNPADAGFLENSFLEKERGWRDSNP